MSNVFQFPEPHCRVEADTRNYHARPDTPKSVIDPDTHAQIEHVAATLASAMSNKELWNFVDDSDLILNTMPAEASKAFVQAHEKLVAAAIVDLLSDGSSLDELGLTL